MRLITRNDASLAVGLIAAAVVVFRRPLRYILDLAREVESRYDLDLIPALTILVCVFVFHQTRKRQQARADAQTAAAEASQARVRSAELQQLMTFGQALANALDPAAIQQALWRHLPTFTHDHEFWVAIRRGERWDPFVQNDPQSKTESMELDRLTSQALEQAATPGSQIDGFVESDTLCYPLVVAGTPVGVLGVRDAAGLSHSARRALGTAAAFLAIAVRNMRLFQTTRETSVRDGLTGCFNRGHALETIDIELRRARRSGRPLSILMLDIDHFKRINDELGHLRGDELLETVGALLARVLRTTDVRCRYGGDEFLVILPETPVLGAQQVAESLRREIALLSVGDGERPVSVTSSVGVAAAVPGELDVAALIERCDSALYRAKRGGRNRFCIATPPSPGLSAAVDAV